MKQQWITPEKAKQLADAFASNSREAGGSRWDFSCASLPHLEQEVRKLNQRVEKDGYAALTFGCYLGEMLVRHQGWEWSLEDAGLMLSKNGVRANPLGKIAACNEEGDSLVEFYEDCELVSRTVAGEDSSGLGATPSHQYCERVKKWLWKEAIRCGTNRKDPKCQGAIDQLVDHFSSVVRLGQLTNSPPYKVGRAILDAVKV